jgi:hypothetical protein
VQQLARDFVVVAEEVHWLYPEAQAQIAQLANDPGHLMFKRYGEAMPPGVWNAKGTKQGIYMMGPEGEYLEGIAAGSGDPADIAQRLERALERWQVLKKQKGYANRPVPRATAEALPSHLDPARMTLRVSLRDLDDKSCEPTPRWQKGLTDDSNWQTWTAWAWNQNWAQLAEPTAFVPTGDGECAVADAAFQPLARETLVDNVRGQAPGWEERHVRTAKLTARWLGKAGKTIEYRGEVAMDAGEQRLAMKLYGQADWDPQRQRFTRFHLVGIGTRAGTWAFNMRHSDKAESPIGITLRLFEPAALPAK